MSEEPEPLAEACGGGIATGLIVYGLYTGNMIVFLSGVASMTVVVTVRSFAR